jgi:hypothetical protein
MEAKRSVIDMNVAKQEDNIASIND